MNGRYSTFHVPVPASTLKAASSTGGLALSCRYLGEQQSTDIHLHVISKVSHPSRRFEGCDVELTWSVRAVALFEFRSLKQIVCGDRSERYALRGRVPYNITARSHYVGSRSLSAVLSNPRLKLDCVLVLKQNYKIMSRLCFDKYVQTGHIHFISASVSPILAYCRYFGSRSGSSIAVMLSPPSYVGLGEIASLSEQCSFLVTVATAPTPPTVNLASCGDSPP